MDPRHREDKMITLFQEVRNRRPLVCHVTNSVVTNWTANVTLAVGAAPVMTHSQADGRELLSAASALVLNMGTAEGVQLDLMFELGLAARRAGLPVVFDPVGVGATSYRTMVGQTLLREVRPTVIRANSGEAFALAGEEGKVRGVDAAAGSRPDEALVRRLAETLGATLAVTGKEDLVAGPDGAFVVEGGHELLTRVTGTGCAATTLVACFLAVAPEEPALAAAAALGWFKVAAERAAAACRGPGSFAVGLLDELALLGRDAGVLPRVRRAGQRAS